ncbi:MAG: thioredoxin family protein [Chromatiales bacterium]|nr:thioredoxin family protein [Chromatiales bacterium]
MIITARLHVAAICIALAAMSVQAATTNARDPLTHFFSQSLGDFHEELAVAREQGKLGILLMFQQEECPYCHRMKTTILNQPDVQDYFRQHFLAFQVDVEGDVTITDFTGQPVLEKDFAFKLNRVRATPVFAFFDLDGNRIERFTGATSSKEEFMLLGEFVVSGAHKTTNFNQYKRERMQPKSAQAQ